MRTILLMLLMTGLWLNGQAAPPDSLDNTYTNAADELLIKDQKLLVGGYGEVHYNQPLQAGQRNNGKLDVHRMVMLFGYQFDKRTQFITELEFEHVSEVYVEQAFIQYKLNQYVNARAGLMLVPMGIINEYHEPTTFNGVERPLTDTYLVPSTWREIGLGITGNYLPASLKYQLYIINGFNGYDGEAHLSGSNGLRKGRQKGAESFISSPNAAARIEYFGIRGLNIGWSGYLGKTQSTLYNGIDKNDAAALAGADSSVVAVSMLGLDARYNTGAFSFRGQFYLSQLGNAGQYNVFTAPSDGTTNDVGNTMMGYYIEGAVNVLKGCNTDLQLFPFVRYEYLNTHQSVPEMIEKNKAYEKTIITPGFTLHLTRGAVVKADVQLIKSAADQNFKKVLNAGFGIMF